jgi:hypothetical protein
MCGTVSAALPSFSFARDPMTDWFRYVKSTKGKLGDELDLSPAQAWRSPQGRHPKQRISINHREKSGRDPDV